MKQTVYKRNSVYTFFIGVLLVIPTIVLFLSMEFILGIIALLIIFILIAHHFGIQYDELGNELVIYSGYTKFHKVKKRIKLSSITSYKKKKKKIRSSYTMPVNSHSTSVKSFRLEIEINNDYKMTLLSGTEKSIDKMIEIIETNT